MRCISFDLSGLPSWIAESLRPFRAACATQHSALLQSCAQPVPSLRSFPFFTPSVLMELDTIGGSKRFVKMNGGALNASISGVFLTPSGSKLDLIPVNRNSRCDHLRFSYGQMFVGRRSATV